MMKTFEGVVKKVIEGLAAKVAHQLIHQVAFVSAQTVARVAISEHKIKRDRLVKHMLDTFYTRQASNIVR